MRRYCADCRHYPPLWEDGGECEPLPPEAGGKEYCDKQRGKACALWIPWDGRLSALERVQSRLSAAARNCSSWAASLLKEIEDMPYGGTIETEQSPKREAPEHYKCHGGDAIDAMSVLLEPEELAAAYKFNVIKYLARCDKKGDRTADLKKAAEYLELLAKLEIPGK